MRNSTRTKQISPAVSAPHPRGNGLGLRRKRLRPRPERREQFAVVTVENDGSLLHSNIFKEINYPSYSIPIPMAFSSRPVFLSSRVRCWQPSSHQDAVETFRGRQMLRGRSRVSTCADRGSNEQHALRQHFTQRFWLSAPRLPRRHNYLPLMAS